MNTKQAFEGLKALGAKVELLDGGIKLNGYWEGKYNDYHESIIEITGTLYTPETTQQPGFLRNLTTLGKLSTGNAIQHPDFLQNLTTLGQLITYHSIQHQEFLRNVKTLGRLYTSYTIQHPDFLRNLKSLGELDTSHAAQHSNFLKNIETLGSLRTDYAIQQPNFLQNLKSLGKLYATDVVQYPDFLRNLTTLGDMYTWSAIQLPDFLRNVKSLGYLSVLNSIQHQDFLKRASDDFELPLIYADGTLSEVSSTKVVDGITVHKSRPVGYDAVEFIATDGEFYAHASTLKMALIDLRLKQSHRDTSWLEEKTIDDVLSFDDAVLAYRCITGACSGGVERFLKRQHEQKEEYQIKEIMELTKNEYGSKQFASFFN